MSWYWIVPIVIWAIGVPWGCVRACDHVGSFYKHPMLDGFDILAAGFVFLFQFFGFAVLWPIMIPLYSSANNN